MVFPLIVFDSNKRSCLNDAASIGNFVVFITAFIIAIFDLCEYAATKTSIAPLLATKSTITSIAPLVSAISMTLTALLHLWAWIFVKDQHLRHTRWKTNTILKGVYISIVAIVITFVSTGLHGFYWFNFKKNLSYGMLEAMRRANESAELSSHLHDIQINYSCCGINSLTDYLRAPEITFPNGKNPSVSFSWTGCESEYCYIPFSCCRAVIYDCTPWAVILRDKYDLVNKSFVDKMYHQFGCVSAVGARHNNLTLFILSGCLWLLELIVLTLNILVSTSTFVIEKVGAKEDSAVPSWILPYGLITPKAVVEHTYQCSAAEIDFNQATLVEAVLKKKQLLKQRTMTLCQMPQN